MQSKCSLSYRLHSAFGNQSITFDIYLTLCFDKHALNINNRMIDNNLHYKTATVKTVKNCIIVSRNIKKAYICKVT